MDYLLKAMLEDKIKGLHQAIADERLIPVLVRYHDLVLFLLEGDPNDEVDNRPYDALNAAFSWLQHRIGFQTAPPPALPPKNPRAKLTDIRPPDILKGDERDEV
jgi:hypothetical protein